MSMEPFRFLHAADVRLDHAFRGLRAVPSELRETIQDATLTAFEHVIEACLSQAVDFLLLSGTTLPPDDHSLAAELAFERGCERLAEQGIAVFLTQPLGLTPRADLPGNVTLIGSSPEPVKVEREGALVATIHGEPGGQPAGAFAIGLSHAEAGNDTASHPPDSRFRYLSLEHCNARTVRSFGPGVVHAPGPTQGVSPRELGPTGCTLVEVERSGRVSLSFVPTAPVRWEGFGLRFGAETSRAALLDIMRSTLEALERQPTDRVCLLSWTLHGQGPLLEAFNDAHFRDELCVELQETVEQQGLSVWTHEIRLLDSRGIEALVPAGDRLAADFVEHLKQGRQEHGPLASGWSGRIAPGVWQTRLQSLLAECDEEEIVRAAGREGLAWLVEQKEQVA